MSLEMYGKCGNERVSTEMYPPENWIGCYPNYARGYHEGSCHGDRRPCLKCALDISSDTGVRGPQNYFVIKKAFSCQTSLLVYYISYIGETGRTLRQRFGEHLRSIEKRLLGYPVAEHFNTAGHSIDDALVRGMMLSVDYAQRKRLEMRLIFQLGTS